jgi:hypothetical protein
MFCPAPENASSGGIIYNKVEALRRRRTQHTNFNTRGGTNSPQPATILFVAYFGYLYVVNSLNYNNHHLHGQGSMTFSGSTVHRILGLPGFLLPVG